VRQYLRIGPLTYLQVRLAPLHRLRVRFRQGVFILEPMIYTVCIQYLRLSTSYVAGFAANLLCALNLKLLIHKHDNIIIITAVIINNPFFNGTELIFTE